MESHLQPLTWEMSLLCPESVPTEIIVHHVLGVSTSYEEDRGLEPSRVPWTPWACPFYLFAHTWGEQLLSQVLLDHMCVGMRQVGEGQTGRVPGEMDGAGRSVPPRPQHIAGPFNCVFISIPGLLTNTISALDIRSQTPDSTSVLSHLRASHLPGPSAEQACSLWPWQEQMGLIWLCLPGTGTPNSPLQYATLPSPSSCRKPQPFTIKLVSFPFMTLFQ